MRLGKGWWVVMVLWMGLAESFGCGGARPYRRMAEAETSLLSVPAQARDQELQIQLRRAVIENPSLNAFGITVAVFMERAYVVGAVGSQTQADAMVAAARSVSGLRSVQAYLPVEGAGESMASGVELVTSIKSGLVESGLPATRYDVKVVNATVVLLGVVATPEERVEVEQVVRSIGGVKEVANFLAVLDERYGSLRPHLR